MTMAIELLVTATCTLHCLYTLLFSSLVGGSVRLILLELHLRCSRYGRELVGADLVEK